MKVSFGSNIFDSVVQTTAVSKPQTQQQVVPQQQITATTQTQDSYTAKLPETPAKSQTTLDKILKYSGIASIIALPIVAVVMHKVNKKTIKALTEQITNQNNLIKGLQEALSKSDGANSVVVKEVQKQGDALWKAVAGIIGGASLISKLNEDKKEGASTDVLIERATQQGRQTIEGIQNDSKAALDKANSTAGKKGPLHSKYVEDVHGFKLLKGVDKKAGYNEDTYNKAVATIQASAAQYLNGEAQQGKKPLKIGDTVWSITSEFAPIKEGGLGSVPVEIQANFETLGINTPTFIPMYQKNGFASLNNYNGTYSYNYSGTKFDLEKVAEFKIHSYKSHDSKDEPVEVFVSTSRTTNGTKVKTPPLVFIKNDEYFNGTIYSATAKSEEPEKFAFFTKAVYEFAKAKVQPESVKGLQVFNPDVYNSIATPDGLLLNDWQASPMAALARYKAPMENAYGVLSEKAAKTLSEIPIMTVGHNAQYQGSTLPDNDYDQKVESSENILNTLFDNFASDIVKHAETGSPHENLQNVLVINKGNHDNHVNFLNMGICLSDYFAPVSKNYAKELVNENAKSGALQWAIEQKDSSNTLTGIINGNDLHNISIETMQPKIAKLTGANLQTYNAQSSLEEIKEARLNNKEIFMEQFIKPFTQGTIDPKYVQRLENVGNTSLPYLTRNELAQTPIFSFVHRLVEQKGVDILVEAVKKLYNNWDKDFPGKPKPIFYLGGEDGSKEKEYRKMIEKLKTELKPEDSNRIVFTHGFTPIHGYMAATDFFLMPSKFEPCGLTQSESFAQGTPVIATATGGIVDTVIADGDKQTGILTTDINGEGFYNAIKQGVNIFHNDKEKYDSMVMNAIKSDFSWIQPNKQGPIYEYLEKFGLDKKNIL